MILSHEKKFIFLKTRKVAGTSLEIVLSQLCGPRDILTLFGGRLNIVQEDEAQRLARSGRRAQNYEMPLSGYSLWQRLTGLPRRNPIRLYYEHMPAERLKDLTPPAVWSEYFKFSVIRNPFDFAVSNYHWYRKTGRTEQDFRSFLLDNAWAQTVNSRITEIDGEPVVDFMLRYEYLAEDLVTLSEHLNIDPALWSDFTGVRAKGSLRPKSSTTRDAFKDFPEGVAFVRDTCRTTFERYGYAPDPE
ncbi:sulfotransferase family 2 domain-containing protein [Pseudooceanicola nitratireducens]|uniref:sulfotransferase family 2 domain-containing protein n=1 Tax=Pseudooceanicola nitratireducens TaxID=517719 RepID=UPI001C93CAE5|nr:sulfotransferase family 2 domain-containing protein [Pseudooceanicola nitratireducens]MBY6159179.1 sulfotransferase family 2 domain-containing protein [Pseudooceanicola nitratireducens]